MIEINETVSVEAPPASVWQAVINERVNYNTRIVNIKLYPTHSTYGMSQEYPSPIGKVKVTYEVVEYPGLGRIEFKLTDSNVLRTMDGSWNIHPMAGGAQASLNLKVEDVSTKVPVPRTLVRHFAINLVKYRLQEIKKAAEHGG